MTVCLQVQVAGVQHSAAPGGPQPVCSTSPCPEMLRMPTSVGIVGKPLPCKKDLMPVGNGFWKSLNHSHLGANKTSRNAWIWRSLGQPCCQRSPVGGAVGAAVLG